MKVVTTNLLNRFWKNGVIPIKYAISSKFDTSKIVKSANITEEGFVMDGKTASEKFAELNGKFDKFQIKKMTLDVRDGYARVDDPHITLNTIILASAIYGREVLFACPQPQIGYYLLYIRTPTGGLPNASTVTVSVIVYNPIS